MKKDDIVQFKLDRNKEIQEGRVMWIKEENVGVILNDHLPPAQRSAIVIPISDCEVVAGYKGEKLKHEIHDAKTDELKAAIQRLKGMRFPRRVKVRGRSNVSPSRRQKLTRLLEAIDGSPDALDALIDKALKEEGE